MTGAGPSSAPIRAAVLTVSISSTLAEDASGDALAGLVESLGGQLLGRDLVADDRAAIAALPHAVALLRGERPGHG